MQKSPKELAALIIAKKPRVPEHGLDDMDAEELAEGEDDGPSEDLQLLAGDVFDAVKHDDEEAFAEALETFVRSIIER